MKNNIIIGVIALVSVLYWLILFFEFNIFQIVPGYLWHFMQYSDKPLSLLWLIVPVAGLFYFIISYVLKKPANYKRNLLLLILLGYLTQMSFGFMEGRGIDGLRQRLVTTGHAEFAKIAAIETDMVDVAHNYEGILEEIKLIKFARSKPPGHLMFYMLTEKVSNAFSPSSELRQRFRKLVTLASYLYPLIAYLVIIPLFYLSRNFLKESHAYLPSILYLVLPSVTLVTLHLDQVLYPMLFITALLLIINGCKKDNIYYSVLSGGFIYFALYFSFSLLPLIPFGLLTGASYIYCNPSAENKYRLIGRFIIGLIIGWIAANLLMLVTLNYDIALRYHNAILFHQAWKHWEATISNIALYGILNYIEFICWIGLPVSLLFMSGSRRKIAELIKGQFNQQNLLFAIIILIFLLLGIFGKTKSEVGRLWIFMMPVVLIIVSFELQERFKDKIKSMLWFLLSLQLITILFIKRFQDFW